MLPPFQLLGLRLSFLLLLQLLVCKLAVLQTQEFKLFVAVRGKTFLFLLFLKIQIPAVVVYTVLLDCLGCICVYHAFFLFVKHSDLIWWRFFRVLLRSDLFGLLLGLHLTQAQSKLPQWHLNWPALVQQPLRHLGQFIAAAEPLSMLRFLRFD
jgi:hypothetical protein